MNSAKNWNSRPRPEDVAKARRVATGIALCASHLLAYYPLSMENRPILGPPFPNANPCPHPCPPTRTFSSPKGRMSMAAAARQMGLDPSELGDVSIASLSLSWLLSTKWFISGQDKTRQKQDETRLDHTSFHRNGHYFDASLSTTRVFFSKES